MLRNLFAKDAGSIQPNLSANYVFKAEDGNEIDMEYPENCPARPYLWAQWICGFQYSIRNNDLIRPEPSIRHVMNQV
jgi:hypothetical protein